MREKGQLRGPFCNRTLNHNEGLSLVFFSFEDREVNKNISGLKASGLPFGTTIALAVIGDSESIDSSKNSKLLTMSFV